MFILKFLNPTWPKTLFDHRTAYEWVNPAAYGLVVVTSSEGRNLPYGRLEDILSRDSSALNCHTNDDKNAWFAIDLGLWVIPLHTRFATLVDTVDPHSGIGYFKCPKMVRTGWLSTPMWMTALSMNQGTCYNTILECAVIVLCYLDLNICLFCAPTNDLLLP